MKQLFGDLRSGSVFCLDTPLPSVGLYEVLIESACSLISLGTERMLVNFGKANWLGKAVQQPDKVKRVIDKVRTDGLLPTVKAVYSQLETPLPLGYSNVGTVLKVGGCVTAFKPGDRVLSNGPHAEIVCVSESLCSRVPEGVSDEAAAFGVVASVALEGIRLAQPTIGESVAVIGIGLIGLLTIQILRANGCRVIAFESDEGKASLAAEFGAVGVVTQSSDQCVRAAYEFTNGRGIDAVLITASTSSSGPISEAARMCRKRGRIVLVGATGLELSREDFYEKELSFQVSCSYGPGRYENDYERKGLDYPVGYVRWTAQRNFEAILELMQRGLLTTGRLISERITFQDAPSFYRERLFDSNVVGCLIKFSTKPRFENTVRRVYATSVDSLPVVGMIGAGDFARAVLLPALSKSKVRIKAIASRRGVNAAFLAKQFDIAVCTTDYTQILCDPEIRAVLIATRHDLHASLVCEALEAGKHIFVEKPLCLTKEEEERIKEVHSRHPDLTVMVGFNRRHSPLIVETKKLLKGRQGPLAMTITVNAGDLPGSHWTKDAVEGGGRIKGEACHFEDLLAYLAESDPVERVEMHAERNGNLVEDVCSISLRFADGSIGTIQYFANGSKRWPKEDLLIFSDGRVLRIENFRKLSGEGFGRRVSKRLWRQDKGHEKEVEAWVTLISGDVKSERKS